MTGKENQRHVRTSSVAAELFKSFAHTEKITVGLEEYWVKPEILQGGTNSSGVAHRIIKRSHRLISVLADDKRHALLRLCRHRQHKNKDRCDNSTLHGPDQPPPPHPILSPGFQLPPKNRK